MLHFSELQLDMKAFIEYVHSVMMKIAVVFVGSILRKAENWKNY